MVLVALRSRDPRDEPIVAFNLLSDDRDMKRMVMGIRFLYQTLMTQPVPASAYSIFAGAYTSWIRHLSSTTWYNKILTSIGAFLLDRSALARKMIMRVVVPPKYDLHQMIKDDAAIEKFARETVLGNWHACCTCRMGSSSDSGAVVDSRGRVHGVEGLRVADASIMPSVPCANTNLTTIMIAEKISDAILTDASSQRLAHVS
jgi:5-(hydroxymethyl)furfural/furfural oxidase